MVSYFTTLMQQYGPAEPPAATLPEMTAAAEPEPAAAPQQMVQPEVPLADIPPDPPPEPAPAGDADLFQTAPATDPFEPSDFKQADFTPDNDPAVASPEIITEAIAHVTKETVMLTPESPDPAIGDPAPEMHLHETHQTDVHVTETHVHEVMNPAQEDDLPVPPRAAPRQLEEPEDLAPHDAVRDATLGALEAKLEQAFAKLTERQQPPMLNVIEAADFEPEAAVVVTQFVPEQVREVTREIVKEVHHHHHETQIARQSAPTPRTAASASQIGPIRFASHWGQGGTG